MTGAFENKIPRARTLKAWTSDPDGQGHGTYHAHPKTLPDWVETTEQAATALGNCLTHKGTIWVLRSDDALPPERRHLLSVFYVKKRSSRRYVRLSDGTSAKEPEFYADLIGQVCVAEGFSPVEPFKWTPQTTNAEIVGHDTKLIEGRVE